MTKPAPAELIDGRQFASLTSAEATQFLLVSSIEWDTGDSDDKNLQVEECQDRQAATISFELPTSLIVAVEALVDAVDIDLADRLTNQYGFLIKELSFTTFDRMSV